MAAALAVLLGMAVPLSVGMAVGQIGAGLAAALGVIFVNGADIESNARAQIRSLLQMLAVVGVAIAAASVAAGRGGWTDTAITGLAGTAALIGGYSYPLALATARFIPFLVMSISFLEQAENRMAVVILVLLGALWASLATFVIGMIFRSLGPRTTPAPRPGTTQTIDRRLRHWAAKLKTLAGWQFFLRVVPALAIAGIVRTLWPGHHFLWIALTVGLLCQRQLERVPRKAVERAAGAAGGVAATALLIGHAPPAWGLVLAVAALGGFAAQMRARSYLAYTAAMTPLIILLLTAGGPVSGAVLVDRLVATLIAAMLVLAANAAVAAALNVDHTTTNQKET